MKFIVLCWWHRNSWGFCFKSISSVTRGSDRMPSSWQPSMKGFARVFTWIGIFLRSFVRQIQYLAKFSGIKSSSPLTNIQSFDFTYQLPEPRNAGHDIQQQFDQSFRGNLSWIPKHSIEDFKCKRQTFQLYIWQERKSRDAEQPTLWSNKWARTWINNFPLSTSIVIWLYWKRRRHGKVHQH